MKIALVGLTHPFRGGISHHTTLLCEALSKKHTVRFFALKRQYPKLFFPGRAQIDDSQNALRVPHEPCLNPMDPLTWLATVERIRRFEADFILLPWWHPFFAPAFGTIAFLARRIGRIPSCFLCHNVLPHERLPGDQLLLRYAFASASAFVTHSQADRDVLLKIKPAARVLVASHPTYEVFSAGNQLSMEAAKEQIGLQGRKVLLFFGLVREYKGLTYLLEAVPQLEPEDGYHLLLVGEFYEGMERYRRLMDRLADRGQMTVVDRYVMNDEVPLYFSAADLVILPYTSGSQSGVIQLAYGFGKPVVATEVGGIPEAVVDGRTGYLVPPADPEAIARAVRRYFKEDRRDMFSDNITREREKYSWDRMVDAIENTGRTLRPEPSQPNPAVGALN